MKSIAVVSTAGSLQVSVGGLAAGGHAVHVHTDCSGSPSRHVATLGRLIVGPDGTGEGTFPLAPGLAGRGLRVLVYPIGAAQGIPDVCARI